MSKKQIEKIAKALADPNRLDIIEMIRGQEGLSCGEIVDKSKLSQPTVSHHLKILIESELVLSEKEGRCLHLKLNHGRLNEFQDFLSQIMG